MAQLRLSFQEFLQLPLKKADPYEINITQLKSHWKHYVCKWKMLIQKHFLPLNNATSFKQCMTLFIHYNIVVCNKTGFIACSETTLPGVSMNVWF